MARRTASGGVEQATKDGIELQDWSKGVGWRSESTGMTGRTREQGLLMLSAR